MVALTDIDGKIIRPNSYKRNTNSFVGIRLWPGLTVARWSRSTPGPFNIWMGNRLWAGKPSRYVTSHLGQLSLPSLRGR